MSRIPIHHRVLYRHHVFVQGHVQGPSAELSADRIHEPAKANLYRFLDAGCRWLSNRFIGDTLPSAPVKGTNTGKYADLSRLQKRPGSHTLVVVIEIDIAADMKYPLDMRQPSGMV